ncbi:MAG: 4-hydroxy-tetrahydrodipicolinate reductase [Thermodesulfobacteriota bacterium]|nr:4-hydroxy-tetrahydrodipicolinate reductase [Thermodesulfobacteriota bacterium]
MTVRVLVNGIAGRMGSLSAEAIRADDDLELAGGVDIGGNLSAAIAEFTPNIVIDFTTPKSVFENAKTIIAAGVHPVIGTSGISTSQIEVLQAHCAKRGLGGLIVPNFAISAVLMMKFAREAARYFPNVEIVELHHDAKVDAPSGTAIRTAELIAESRSQFTSTTASSSGNSSSRGSLCEGIPIHAVRLPGFVAHQEVIFGGNGQALTIRQDSFSRESFAAGICLACRKVGKLQQLYYGLEHIL